MKHSFKKQLDVAMTALCLMTIFLIAAPTLSHANSLPGPATTYYNDMTSSPPVATFPPASPYQTAPANSSLTPINDFTGLSGRLASIGTVVIYLLTALAVIYIVWNVVQALIKGKEGGDRKEALLHVMWGLIGLFIILSLWGLVNILLQTFGTNTAINLKSKLPQADFVNTSATGQ